MTERVSKIRPFKESDEKYLSFFTHAFYDIDSKEIALGTDEEQTISALWHEEFHAILYEMFDFDITGKYITTEIDKSGIMHEIELFLFGKPKKLARYKAQQEGLEL